MNRSVVSKSSLHRAEEASCTALTVEERLAVLAELNRIGLAAIGMADAPLRRTAVRKHPFRDFRDLATGQGLQASS